MASGSCRSNQPQNVLCRWWHRLAEEHFRGTLGEQHKRCRLRTARPAPRLTLPQCSRRRGMRSTGTCASPIARRPRVNATSCSSRIGSHAANTCRSCHPLQGWVEAMTSLGRLIFFDQPGSGASDPVEPGALPTLEQWADSITAVLDDLGSREAVLLTAARRVSAGGAIRCYTSVSHHRARSAGGPRQSDY